MSSRSRERGDLAQPREGHGEHVLRLARLPDAEPDREGSVAARPASAASPGVRDALVIWLLTRVSVVLLAVAGSWLLAKGTAGLQPGFVELWDRWDVRVFVKIARFGYLGYPQDYPDTGTAAFFPGMPGALWLVHLLAADWVVTGLLVSLVAGGVAAAALARLAAADHGEPVASRSVLYLAVSPFAVFLAAGYSEALFLAFAIPAWLAARQRRWLLAGVLGGFAGTVRVTALFLGAALIVQWALSGRDDDGRRRWRDLPALLLPWAVVGGFVVYLHAITGDWLAWQHVQAQEFGRRLVLPMLYELSVNGLNVEAVSSAQRMFDPIQNPSPRWLPLPAFSFFRTKYPSDWSQASPVRSQFVAFVHVPYTRNAWGFVPFTCSSVFDGLVPFESWLKMFVSPSCTACPLFEITFGQ